MVKPIVEGTTVKLPIYIRNNSSGKGKVIGFVRTHTNKFIEVEFTTRVGQHTTKTKHLLIPEDDISVPQLHNCPNCECPFPEPISVSKYIDDDLELEDEED